MPAMPGWHRSEKGNITLKNFCISRAAQVVPACQPGCEKMKRKWRENEEVERKWRMRIWTENKEINREGGNGQRMRK